MCSAQARHSENRKHLCSSPRKGSIHTWLKFCSSYKTYLKGHLLPRAYGGTSGSESGLRIPRAFNLGFCLDRTLIMGCLVSQARVSSSYFSPASTWKMGSMCSSSLCPLQSLTSYLAQVVLQKCLSEGGGWGGKESCLWPVSTVGSRFWSWTGADPQGKILKKKKIVLQRVRCKYL